MRTLIALSFVAVALAQHREESSSGGNAGSLNGVAADIYGDLNVGSESTDSSTFAPQIGLNHEFYTYTVDENDFNDNATQSIPETVGQIASVVFVRGIDQKGLEDAAHALAKNSGRNAAIYVLNSESDLAIKVDSVENSAAPEAYFVKYRTVEDATNAKEDMQTQYDYLGSSFKIMDGGAAPFFNFDSQAIVGVGPVVAVPVNSFLSSSILHQIRQ